MKKQKREEGFQSKLWRWFRPFLMAVAFVLAALGPEYFLVKRFFPYPFLFLFFGAVIASAWFGGLAAGLLAVVLSIFAVDYFFIPPVYSFVVNSAALVYLATFVACALVAGWVSAAKKRTEEALKEARDELELRVSARTADLMKTQAELAHLSRVLTMGELTTSIAHEIKQPLTAIVTNAQACLEWLSATPPNIAKAQQSMQHVVQNGTRAGEILTRIRAMFKKEPIAKQMVDLNDVIQELVILLLADAKKSNICLHAELMPGFKKVEADRVQLQQVVLNMLLNAIDAVREHDTSRKEIVVRTIQPSSSEIGVQVEDSGTGISPELAARVFEPFFTTKEQGIGMGLSISRSIIESYGGHISAIPGQNGGACFQFTIPFAAVPNNE